MAALIRCGELCRGCSRNACLDPPTPEESAQIDCPDCEGLGYHGDPESSVPCSVCGGEGFFVLDGCPKRLIGVKVAGAVNLASWAGKGHLPLAGGVLDQDAWFMSAWSALENDVSKIESDKRSRK